MKAHSWNSQSTNPPSELVQVRVGESSLKSLASSGKFSPMRLKLSSAAAELLKEGNSSSPVKKVVCISDHRRNVFNFHDGSLGGVPWYAVRLWN